MISVGIRWKSEKNNFGFVFYGEHGDAFTIHFHLSDPYPRRLPHLYLTVSCKWGMQIESLQNNVSFIKYSWDDTCTQPHDQQQDMGSMDFAIESYNTIHQLQACLDAISRPCVVSTTKWLHLRVFSVNITPPILALLVQILNQPQLKAPNGTGSKWDEVSLYDCTFARPGTTQLTVNDEGFCSQDNIQLFVSGLACRTARLTLSETPEVLEYLLNTPHLELQRMYLYRIMLPTSECARLGDLVQRSCSLNDLALTLVYLEEPLLLANAVANAFHLQCVSFDRMSTPYRQSELSDILVRNGGNSINTEQLLSPHRRLQKLRLPAMDLKDRHFLPIVEMLPTSQLQYLDVSSNHIGIQGILAFANQLPRIKCLKKAKLSNNAWEYPHDHNGHHQASYRECIAAMLLGMIENYSIECLELYRRDKQLEYCTHANRARRRIWAIADSSLVGLWPWILERVGTRNWNPTWDGELKFRNYRANALYFVLQQNCPILSSIRSSPWFSLVFSWFASSLTSTLTFLVTRHV